jgi:O-antigen/teichoic acid export membrane protein
VTSSSISQAVEPHLLRNALFNSSSWCTIVLVNLVAIPLFIRYLGVEGYGIYLLLTGLFGYFGLLDFGLSDSVVKYVAHHQELGNHESVAESVNAALLVQVIGGGVGVSVLCVFNQQIIKALHVSPALAHVASLGIYVSAVGFLFKMLLNTYNAALKGLQRFDILAKTTAGFSLATAITAVLVLIAGGGLLEVIVVTALMTVANLVTVLLLVSRCIPRYRLGLRVSRESFRALFGFGAYTFVTRIAGALNTYILQVVIAVILGAGAVAYFAVPLRVTSGMEAGLSSLVAVIFPFVSKLKAQENLETLQRLYSNASRYVVALSTPPYLFIIIFSRQILRIWLGPVFADKGWPVLALLATSSLLATWTMVPANTAFGTGDIKVTAAFSSVVAGLNLLFSVLFTIKLGVTGTAAAVLVTSAQAPVFIWYVTSRVVRVSPRKYFGRVFAFHIAPACGFLLFSLGILWATGVRGGHDALFPLALGTALIALYYYFLLRFRFVSLSELGRSG